MRVSRTQLALALALAILASRPASAESRFYGDLLQRGISDAIRGESAKALNELRIAAFGFLDDLPKYQKAQVYLAVACERAQRKEDSRLATTKVLIAERMEPSYMALEIDSTTRAAFDRLLPAVVKPEQYANLSAFNGGRTNGVVVGQPLPLPAPRPSAPLPGPPSALSAPVTNVHAPEGPGVSQAPQAATSFPANVKAEKGPSQRAPIAQKPAEKSSSPIGGKVQGSATPVPVAGTTAVPVPIGWKGVPRDTPAPSGSSARSSPASLSPLTAAARHTPSQSPYVTDFSTQISEAGRLLNEGKIIAARQAFSRTAQLPGAPRNVILDAARGLSQTSGWAESSLIYKKLFPLHKGEESHFFYEAINRYQLGDTAVAREMLVRALPYMPATREVASYRVKIENTQ